MIPIKPRHQTVLLIGLLLFCWLAMMLVHELGHMIGAWLTGGHVVQLVWHPLVFSRTDLFPLNAPLFVVWSGPVIGILLPVMLDALACWRRWPMAGCLTFFAGFCLIANGLYISIGSLDRIADAGDMLRLGTPQWVMMLFGLLTVPAGLWQWHRASYCFGFGKSSTASQITARQAWLMFAIGLALLLIGFVCGNRG